MPPDRNRETQRPTLKDLHFTRLVPDATTVQQILILIPPIKQSERQILRICRLNILHALHQVPQPMRIRNPLYATHVRHIRLPRIWYGPCTLRLENCTPLLPSSKASIATTLMQIVHKRACIRDDHSFEPRSIKPCSTPQNNPKTKSRI